MDVTAEAKNGGVGGPAELPAGRLRPRGHARLPRSPGAAHSAAALARRTALQTTVVLAVLLIGWMLAHALVAVFLTAVALLLAVALDRPIRWMERRGAARGLGIAAVLAAWALVLGALVWLFVPPAIGQLGELASSAPQLLDKLQHSEAYTFLTRHLPQHALESAVPKRADDVLGSLLSVASGVLGGVAGLVTVYFLAAFMLASGRALVRAWLGRLSGGAQRHVGETLGRVYDSLGGYVVGLFLIVAINAVLTSTFLGIIGVPWFLPLGLLSGLSSLVPYVGALIAGALLTAVSWASGGTWLGVGTLGYFLVYQQLENHVIAPLVYRRSVDVNPLVILASALFLAEIWGVPGAVLAVPLAASAQIIAREVLRTPRP